MSHVTCWLLSCTRWRFHMKDISDLHFDIYAFACHLLSRIQTLHFLSGGERGWWWYGIDLHAPGRSLCSLFRLRHVKGQQRTGRVPQPSDAPLFDLRVPGFLSLGSIPCVRMAPSTFTAAFLRASGLSEFPQSRHPKATARPYPKAPRTSRHQAVACSYSASAQSQPKGCGSSGVPCAPLERTSSNFSKQRPAVALGCPSSSKIMGPHTHQFS